MKGRYQGITPDCMCAAAMLFLSERMLVTWLPSTSLMSNSSAIYFSIREIEYKWKAYIVTPNNTPGFGIDVRIAKKSSNCFANPFC